MTTQDSVAAIGAALCRRIGEPRYRLWFAERTRLRWEDTRLIVGVPNHMYLDWLRQAFEAPLREAAAEILGVAVVVEWLLDPELFRQARSREAAAAGTDLDAGKPAGSREGPAPRPLPPSEPPAERARRRPRRWKRLTDFVVGPCNRVALAAAQAVVEHPGEGPNPLVLHGPVGTGKTHLLEGIHADLQAGATGIRSTYLTAEEFTNRFVTALHHGQLSAFRKLVRDSDVLLVDDLHFLGKKAATQEEFVHALDALLAQGAQVVVACDAHPRLIDRLLPELVDRLGGGAAWDLRVPEPTTRKGILQAKWLQPGRSPLPDAVADFLAERLRGNVRELEGALATLHHYAQVLQRPVTVELAREALAEVLRHSVRQVQLADVERAVCQVLHLPAGALEDGGRGWKFSHPRMLAIHLARKHTGATFAEIGRRFGGRNHSTATSADRKVQEWVATDAQVHVGEGKRSVREVLARIERELWR